MTLTELLVATVLVGVVMIGAVSMDYAVRRSKQTSGKSAFLMMQLSAAMTHLTRDAGMTSGDFTNVGISFDDTGGAPDIRNICFRYDDDATPGDLNDDAWNCFSIDAADNILYRCAAQAGVLNPTNGECTAGSRLMIAKLTTTDFFQIVNSTADLRYIQFNLTTQDNIGTPADPMTNPDYTLSNRVSPMAQGRR